MSHILRNQMYLHLNCKEILDSSKQMNPQVSLVSSFILQLFGSKDSLTTINKFYYLSTCLVTCIVILVAIGE